MDASTDIPQSWSWDLGDGNYQRVQNPSHTYASSGTFTVTLTASSNALGSDAQRPTSHHRPAAGAGTPRTSGLCRKLTGTLTAAGSMSCHWYDAQEAVASER